jgi:uncharacterized protein YutE (UPF0331/DUF86 family)
MNGKTIFLMSAIREDLAVIDEIYTKLEKNLQQADKNGDALIVRAYYLHSLYTAFENIFQNVATVFENSIDEAGRWHAQLLERMKLDMMPIRPAVLDQQAYHALDELRRFRHMFRHAYAVQLDPDRLDLVLQRALQLRSLYRQQIERFLDYVQTVE